VSIRSIPRSTRSARASKACFDWLRALPWVVLGSLGAACSPAASPSAAPAAALGASQVQSHAKADRPRLTLVQREGDPQRGLALAVYLGADGAAAAALSRLLELRLQASGFPTAAAHPSPSGFIVHDVASGAEAAARFVLASNAGLRSPLQAAEYQRVAELWSRAPPASAASAGEAALARCSGEMLLPPEQAQVLPAIEQLERRRSEIGPSDVAFAVVGSAEYLKGAAEALQSFVPWPSAGAEPLGRVESPLVAVSRSGAERPSLSVAIWGAPAAAAVASAERLSQKDSLLAVRLSAASPAWSLQRVSSSLSRAGACLRADLAATDTAPSVAAAANAALMALEELEHGLRHVKASRWDLDRQVLAMDNPRQAAAVAAWQALNASFEAPPSELARLVQYTGPLAPGEELAQKLDLAEDAADIALERVRALEAGQSDFWMLLASPCGTRGEDTTNAGSLALTMQSLARGFDGVSGVRLEPWISVDAMGLLAHSGLIDAAETPLEQAERVAEALARAVLSQSPAPDAILRARDELLGALGSEPTPGYWLALRQSSANHPSWLEPRGTWESLSNLPANNVQLQRAQFLRGRLRLATIGNYAPDQAEAAERRLSQLFRGTGALGAQCPPAVRSRPIAGTYRLESRDAPGASAVIALTLPSISPAASNEARWTEFLLNRTGGWLEQALLSPGLVSSVRARVLGGTEAAALVIEIRGVEDQVDQAVAQVRGLLARLRAGAATAADAARAEEYFARFTEQQELDPRQRAVALWRGNERGAAPSLQGLRRLHLSFLDPEREVIVITRPAP
jgi:hypothetical protein